MVGGFALVGGLLLGAVFWQSWKVWQLRDEDAVHPQGILQLKQEAETDDANALDVAIRHYASQLQSRRRTNGQRADALEAAQRLWLAAMAVPLLQLGLALAARLFG